MASFESPKIIIIAFGTMFAVMIVGNGVYALWQKYTDRKTADQRSIDQEARSTFVKLWADSKGFTFWPEGNQMRVAERMEASPNKEFFRADIAMDTTDDSCFVRGAQANRQVWFYALKAVSKSNVENLQKTSFIESGFSHSLFDPRGPHYAEITLPEMNVWCMELQTVSMPNRVTVARKKIKEGDVLDTESNAFEKTFDISDTQESDVLQLIDPAMMDCLMQSPADAFEFADQSVVIYKFSRDISPDMLEQMLQSGLQIAQQVDRNYPKAKVVG